MRWSIVAGQEAVHHSLGGGASSSAYLLLLLCQLLLPRLQQRLELRLGLVEQALELLDVLASAAHHTEEDNQRSVTQT